MTGTPINSSARQEKDQGFALVLTLSLMAFILLSVLLMSSLVRIQASALSTSINEIQAKENAQLALALAISQLQTNAGPDQRVSARADILGVPSDGVSPYWTGIWNSRDMASGPTWLVTDVALDDAVQYTAITDASETNETVEVPIRSISSNQSLQTRSIAWWTTEENTKANIKAFFDPNDTLLHHSGTESPNDIRKQISTAALIDKDFNELAGQDVINYGSSNFTSHANKTVDIGQLPMLFSVNAPNTIDSNRTLLKERYFDYTTHSFSTLTNSWDGGFRLDLSHLRRLNSDSSQATIFAEFSHPNYSDWPFLTPGLLEFIHFGAENTSSIVSPRASESYFNDPVGFKIAPIATEFFLIGDFIVRSFQGGISDEVVFFYYISTELLNPYTQQLELDNGTGRFPDDDGDLRIRITGWPYLVIRNLTQDIETILEMPEILTIANSFNDHDSGFMRMNFSPTGSPAAQYQGSNTQGGVWPMNVGFLGYTPETWDVFEIEFTRDVSGIPGGEDFPTTTGDPLVVEFLEYFTNNEDPVLLQVFELYNWGNNGGSLILEYPAISGDHSSRLVNGVSAMGRNSGNRRLNAEQSTFGIHIRPVDEWNDSTFLHEQNQPLDLLLGMADFRQKTVQIDMTDPVAGDGLYWETFPPAEVTTSERGRTDDFFYGIERFGTSRNARIIDLPRGDILSIGSLNSLNFEGFPFRPLGNVFIDDGGSQITPSGSLDEFNPSMAAPDHFSLSQFYDRYFFSSLPNNTSSLSDDDAFSNLPNGWIRRNPMVSRDDDTLNSAESARQLMIAGGFNVNSTSVPAWRAQLLNHLPFNIIETVVGANLNAGGNQWRSVSFSQNFSPIYQTSDYAGNQNFELFTRNIKDSNTTSRNHHTFRQGFRELARENSFDLTESIAIEIVNGIINWVEENGGNPFASVAEFIDSGVLQVALDSVEGINTLDGRRIPTRAPAFVSAGDIIGQLAPRLFARSDTFTIRFLGEYEGTQAIGEATLQRYPADNDDERLFVLHNFRWL